jgi:hypothetical protein
MNAFRKLIDLFKNPQVLRPFEITQPVYIQTDASLVSLAGILMQKDPKTGKFFIIDSTGRGLKPAEKNLSISGIELAAIIHSLSAFKSYLSLTTEIHIMTDHISLTYFDNIKTTSAQGKLARYSLILSEYNIQIHHVKGKRNYLPDILSRREYPEGIGSTVEEPFFNEAILFISETPNQNIPPPSENIIINSHAEHVEFVKKYFSSSSHLAGIEKKTVALNTLATDFETNRQTGNQARSETIRPLGSGLQTDRNMCLELLTDDSQTARPEINHPVHGNRNEANSLCSDSTVTPIDDLKHMFIKPDKIYRLTAALANLDELTDNEFSEAVLNRGSFEMLRGQNSLGYFKTPDTPLFDDSDFEVACQNVMTYRASLDLISTASDRGGINLIQTETEASNKISDIHALDTDTSDTNLDESILFNKLDFKKEQENDVFFRSIMNFLQKNELPPNTSDARTIVLESDNYFMDNGLLYHWKQSRAKRAAEGKNVIKQLCIPRARVNDFN